MTYTAQQLWMMLSPPLDSQVIPSKTTSFLCPCNEDVVDERVPSAKPKKKEFVRSYSCDVILPKKPHPFRSPMTFLRSTTLPRSYKKNGGDQTGPEEETKLKQLTLVQNDSEWSLDEEYPLCSQPFTATTDNTPFCGLANQPYYARRQSASLGKLNKKKEKGSRSSQNVVQQHPAFDGHYATMRTNRKDKGGEFESNENGSLRRRASSLDFLPEAITKNCSQNGTSAKATPFGRTTSLSQRSPFRKKISYSAEQETSLQGIKELRPKGTKRLRSGLEALFESIEKHDIDELRKILNTIDVNTNELNADQFTPLDVALMCGETEIASILLEHGGKENPIFMDPANREEHLKKLIDVADQKVRDYTATIVNSAGEAKDNERQLREWEWKLLMLRIMYNKFLITDCPKHVPSVTIAPLSNESVVVSITPSADEFDGKNMVTKYRVEWSNREDFSDIKGTKVITDRRQLSCTISDLEKGVGWHFRVQSGNLKGFSQSGYPVPRLVYPSSWHECDLSLPRYYGTSDKLDLLVDELLSFQKEISEKTIDATSDEEAAVSPRQDVTDSPKHRHKKVARGLSKYTNLIFNSAPKLLKKIKRRGIYLAALLYSDDLTHVLVTMDDNLPVVECDDSYSKSLTQEMYWFSKASCTWKDINHMLYFSTKSHSSQSVQIRRKLVQSALALMNATGVNDLGPIHYKPFKDNNGSILLLAVNCIKKNVSWSRSMAMKWIPISKLLKKNTSTNEQVMAPERLIPSVEEQVASHRRSRTKLPCGLYLGYLKLRTSVDVLSIMVPNSHTNVLPYVKIQDIPNVTREEWNWLKNLGSKEEVSREDSSQSLKTFEKRLRKSMNQLFIQLNIDRSAAMYHRIYVREVIELNSEVLFLLICPPCDDICTPPNQSDGFTNLTDYTALPFQAFEMANMMTYQPNIMSSYCRLSSILELENYCMQQIVRQTICHKELKHFKERQSKLGEFQQSVDELWRSSRWVFDTIQACQDKNLNTGICVGLIYRTLDWEFSAGLRCSSSSCSTSTPSDFSEIDGSLDESFNSSKSDHNSSKSDHVLVVHGSKEVGLDESSCIQLRTNDTSTAFDLIKMATEQFVEKVGKADCQSTSALTCNGDITFCRDKLEHLCLVVVSGADEVCLSDQNLVERPWDNGTTYLRFKKDSQWMSGVSTTV